MTYTVVLVLDPIGTTPMILKEDDPALIGAEGLGGHPKPATDGRLKTGHQE